MQVQAVKADVIAALRERARPFENHTSNPASGAAYRQLRDQITLLEETPGETVGDVQKCLLTAAREEEQARNRKALIAGGLFLGLATSLIVCGGPSTNGWIQGFNVGGLMVGAGFALRGLQDEEQRRHLVSQARSLDNLQPDSAASSTGNLRGVPSVALSGPASLTQLRDLLSATSDSLQSMPQPEFEAARKQVRDDLKTLQPYVGPSLAEARQQAEAKGARYDKILKLAPFGLVGGIGCICAEKIAPAFPLVGAGLIVATAVATFSSAYLGSKAAEARQTLDRWEPQLQALRDIDSAGSEMRDWGKEKSAGVVQTERSVMVGGVRIPVKKRD